MTYEHNAEAKLQTLPWEVAQRDALVHAQKELGEYFSVAMDNLGGFQPFIAEIVRQQKDLVSKGITLKNDKGLFNTSILDLKKLKLDASQITELSEDVRMTNRLNSLKSEVAGLETKLKTRHEARDAGMFAVDALGNFYEEAKNKLGSHDAVVAATRVEMDRLAGQGVHLRNHRNQIDSSGINLEAIGLSAESAELRNAERGEAAAGKKSWVQTTKTTPISPAEIKETLGTGFDQAK